MYLPGARKKKRYTPSRSVFVDWCVPLVLSLISTSARPRRSDRTPESYLKFAQDFDRLRKLPNYLALGVFSNPPPATKSMRSFPGRIVPSSRYELRVERDEGATEPRVPSVYPLRIERDENRRSIRKLNGKEGYIQGHLQSGSRRCTLVVSN